MKLGQAKGVRLQYDMIESQERRDHPYHHEAGEDGHVQLTQVGRGGVLHQSHAPFMTLRGYEPRHGLNCFQIIEFGAKSPLI
jgi:hypothetical protein